MELNFTSQEKQGGGKDTFARPGTVKIFSLAFIEKVRINVLSIVFAFLKLTVIF